MRYFGNRNITQSVDWQPHVPIFTTSPAWYSDVLFASQFPVHIGTDKQQILYLMVNRADFNVTDRITLFGVQFPCDNDDVHIYDCYHGTELNWKQYANGESDIEFMVNVQLEALGFGCVLATEDTRSSNPELDSFLSDMALMTKLPLSHWSSTWMFLEQQITEYPATTLYDTPPDDDMVAIPWGLFHFESAGVMIEGDPIPNGVDVQFPFEVFSIG